MRLKIQFLCLTFALSMIHCVNATDMADLIPSRHMWKYVAKTDLNPTPYLLPANNVLQKTMKSIFPSPAILHNTATLTQAGFIPVCIRGSRLHVMKHPAAPGYLFKLYPTSFTDNKPTNFVLQKFVQRCIGAAYIRNLINQNRIRHFTVAQKWLYQIPAKNGLSAQYVLIVQDMQLVTREQSAAAWKKASKTQVKELYSILSHGYPSLAITQNIPYTKKGNFACIDTEYPKRKFQLSRIKRHIPKKLGSYWDSLTKAKNSR